MVYAILGLIVTAAIHFVFNKRVIDFLDSEFSKTTLERYFNIVTYIFILVIVYVLWPLVVVLIAGFFVFKHFDRRG